MGQQITDLQHQRQPALSTTPAPTTTTSTATNNGTWRAADIGFFYPDMPTSWGIGDVIDKEDNPPSGQAWSNLDNTRYTLNDVRNKMSVSAYVSSIVSAAKQCQEFPMVLRAWEHLDLPLRRTIDEPIEGTTIKDFMELLVRKQSNWFDTYEQRQNYRDTRQYDFEQLNRPRPNRAEYTTGYGRTPYAPTYSGIPRYQQQISNATQNVGTQRNPNYGTYARNNPAPWQNRRQETPNQPLLLTQHPYNSGKPDLRNRWHKDPPQLTPRSSTAYTATENAHVATEIPSSEKPNQESPKHSFAEGFYQGAQWA